MPFASRAQEKAAFGGYLGKEMQSHAKEWADETPSQSDLPEHVKPSLKGLKRATGAK